MDSLKCVIFCGGEGTRLKEETEFRPKPLVEVGGFPILWHIMKIYSYYGVKDFILTLGYKGYMIKNYIMDYKWQNNDFTVNLKNQNITIYNNIDEDWNVTCADTGLDSGTGLRLFKIKKFLEEEETFCVTYGDGVANININELLNYHKSHGKLVTMTGLHPRSKFGLILTDKNNFVTQFQEKPVLSDYINGGFMVFNKGVFNYLENKNTMMEEDMLPKIAKDNQIKIYKFDGFWHSMDTYKDVRSLNELWEKSKPWKVWG